MGWLVMRALAGLALMLVASSAAQAQVNWLPELRAGLVTTGLQAGDGLLDPGSIRNGNVELLFSAPDLNAWAVIGELRPHLGATVSFADGGDSQVYAGVSWTVQVPALPLLVEASAGAVLTSALVTAPEGAAARNFGCGVGLRLAGSVGLQLPAGFSLVGTLEHLPDFGSCGDPDRNATNLMVRLGYRF